MSYMSDNIADSAMDNTTLLRDYEDYKRECKELFEEPVEFHIWLGRNHPNFLKQPTNWPAPKEVVEDEIVYSDTDLKNAYFDLERKNDGGDHYSIIDRFADELAEKIQFPRDTAYLIALGSVASAMTRQFYYRLNAKDELTKAPVCLYVVASQPPGTAKSGIFKNLTAPIQAAYIELNQRQAAERSKIKIQMDAAKAELKKATNDHEKADLARKLAELEQQMLETPMYVYAVDDATPEGLRDLAVRQNGMINMVSEESDLVNVLLGSVYGDGRRKTNNSMFLKAWDGEIISVARAGADPISVNVKASLAVLAQDEAIRSILQAGQSGRGINERVLVMRERDMLAEIDYRARRSAIVDGKIRSEYGALCKALVHSEERVFVLSDAANEAIIDYMEHMQLKQRLERSQGEMSFYNDPSIQGVISKAEKQVCKIASVLHAAESFERIKGFDNEISENSVRRAIGIFDQLVHTYIAAAESQGYVGDKPRCDRVMQYLDSVSSRKKHFTTINNIRASVKSHESFSRVDSIAAKLRNDVLPKLQRLNKVVVVGDKVYMNPKEFG